MTGRYDNPIPTQFLASIDCLKIPAHLRWIKEYSTRKYEELSVADAHWLIRQEDVQIYLLLVLYYDTTIPFRQPLCNENPIYVFLFWELRGLVTHEFGN